jgi:hypothetical protein
MKDKDEAKLLGAKWDWEEKKWFVPDDRDINDFKKWIRKNPEPGVGGLYIDLVPSSSWMTNVRSVLTAGEWDKVRIRSYELAEHKCEVCGGQGEKHPVEAHERWSYDDRTGIQKLTGICALCPDCHEVSHFGLASVKGRTKQAFDHLKLVNGWGDNKAAGHIEESFNIWDKRSRMKWSLDLSWLLSYMEFSKKTRNKILVFCEK